DALYEIGEIDRAAIEPETPMGPAAFGFEPCPVRVGEAERGAVVDRRLAQRAGALALAVEFVGGLVAGLEAAGGDEAVAGGVREGEAGGLADFEVRRNAQPCEIGFDALGEFFRRARGVGVIEPEDELAAVAACEQPVEDGRPGIAQMQAAGGGRRVADYGHLMLPSR